MQNLASQRCEPCNGDSPAVPEPDWPALLEALPGWAVERQDGTPLLSRTYRLPDFVRALEFANAVGQLAESEDHHPRLTVEYGRVNVAWWTHAIGGLHRNDFIMAARTDRLVHEPSGR